MAAPSHRVSLFPLSLAGSDKADRECQKLRDDYSSLGFSGTTPKKVIDLTRDVFQIQTNKTLSLNSEGSFRLTMIDRRAYGLGWQSMGAKVSYADNIMSNDVVAIEFNRGEKGDDFETVMMGVVVRVSRQTTVSDNTVTHFVTVEGADLTHWLLVHRTFFWLYAIGPNKQVQVGISDTVRKFTSEAEFLKYFLVADKAIPADEVIARLFKKPGEGGEPGYVCAQLPRAQEMFIYNPMPTKSAFAFGEGDDKTLSGFGEKLIPDATTAAFYGSVVNLLEEFSFKPFCEMWVDVSTEKRGLVNLNFRRTPYDKEDWDALKTATINDVEIDALDIGRADHDLVDLVSVLPRLYDAGIDDLIRYFIPDSYRVDWSRIKDRGVRPQMLSTVYLNNMAKQGDVTFSMPQAYSEKLIEGTGDIETQDGAGNVSLLQAVQEMARYRALKGFIWKAADNWSDCLWRWYSEAHRYWAGQITCKQHPEIRVGERIKLPQTTRSHFYQPMVFYVVGVRHSYDANRGMFATSLSVTRGQGEDAFITVEKDAGIADRAEAESDKAAGQVHSKWPLTMEEIMPDTSV